jgi:hypothetical protein
MIDHVAAADRGMSGSRQIAMIRMRITGNLAD